MLQDSVRTVSAAICAGHGLIALVLVGRSLAGALTRELSPLAACVVVTVAVAVGFCAWLLARWTRAESRREQWLAVAAAFVPPLLVMLVLVPASSVGAIAYATVLVAAFTVAVWIVEDERHSGPLPNAIDPETAAEATCSDSANEGHAGVVQWMSRSEAPGGGETAEGGIKAAFAPGQRQAVLHVSFCPPLPGVPEVECEVLDDAPVEVRVTAAQPYGLRLEARRDDAREPLTTEIGFAAAARPLQAAA